MKKKCKIDMQIFRFVKAGAGKRAIMQMRALLV